MTAHLDAHDGADAAVMIVESLHLGEGVRAGDVGVKNKDLVGRAFKNGISEVIQTASCPESLELA